MEGVHRAVKMAAPLGQRSASQRPFKECSQLQKRKRLFKSEQCLYAKLLYITITHTSVFASTLRKVHILLNLSHLKHV